MAHLRKLNIKCNTYGCQKSATDELYSVRNASHGRYCDKCAQKRLKGLAEIEVKEHHRQAIFDATPKCPTCHHNIHLGRRCGGLDAAGDTCDC